MRSRKPITGDSDYGSYGIVLSVTYGEHIQRDFTLAKLNLEKT